MLYTYAEAYQQACSDEPTCPTFEEVKLAQPYRHPQTQHMAWEQGVKQHTWHVQVHSFLTLEKMRELLIPPYQSTVEKSCAQKACYLLKFTSQQHWGGQVLVHMHCVGYQLLLACGVTGQSRHSRQCCIHPTDQMNCSAARAASMQSPQAWLGVCQC